MFESVLVPLDGSMLSELAIAPALQLARHVGGTVYFMRVPVYPEGDTQDEASFSAEWAAETAFPAHDEATEYLRELRDSVADSGITVRTVVASGDRADAIVDTALAHQADLIVMATHGRRGVSRLLMGSVCDRVLHRTSIPVLIVRKASKMRRLLIPLDGSASAEQILTPALAAAASCEGRVVLLRVVNKSDGEAGIAEAQAYLARVSSQVGSPELPVETAVVTGTLPDAIQQYAQGYDADLIAMSTHGRTGFYRLVRRSISQRVLNETECAMLISQPGNGRLKAANE